MHTFLTQQTVLKILDLVVIVGFVRLLLCDWKGRISDQRNRLRPTHVSVTRSSYYFFVSQETVVTYVW